MARAPFDVVIWGATGFTGKLVAEYFATSVTWRLPNVRWALAGRSREKLAAVKEDVVSLAKAQGLRCSPGIVLGDVAEAATIDTMVQSGRVILSTAGPFVDVGSPIVAACVRHGRDYVDITGELPWVRSMIDRHFSDAKAKKLRIVNMCGFDSIPSDLGTLFLVNTMRRKYGCGVVSVKNYASMKGSLSGGTVASGLRMDGEAAAQMKDVFLLGGAPVSGARPVDSDKKDASYDREVGAWTAPFMMAGLNTRVVRRSNGLSGYGNGFSYEEVTLADSETQAKRIAASAAAATVEVRKKLVAAGKLPKPGQGPSPEERSRSWFRMALRATSEKNDVMYATVSGGDPGYTETAKMVSEAALCLVLDRDRLPSEYGVITPAVAMGEALIGRLEEAGIRFERHDTFPGPVTGPSSKL